MPTQILMPALSPTMEEGKLAKWLVKEGDEIHSGDVLAEIETDKATMEFEAVDEGRMGKLLVAEGTEGVKVNQPIAVLLGEGEDQAAAEKVHEKRSGKESEPAISAPKHAAGDISAAMSSIRNAVAAEVPEHRTSQAADGERVFATPLARRLAQSSGIDLSALHGSGPRGRIVKADIEAAQTTKPASPKKDAAKAEAARSATPAASAAAAPATPGALPDARLYFQPGDYEEIPHDSMRRTIARRLTIAKAAVPHFYLTVDCRIDELLSLRARLNAASPKDQGAFRLSVNDFVVKASALALIRVPAVNASWTETAMLRHHHADIGIAVALDFGLITPIVFRAEEKGLVAISNEVKSLAERARTKKLKPNEYEGGGFSISNLGMFGIKNFTGVINPPHAAILAVGAGEERVVVRQGKMEVAQMMTVTMSCDHRVIDGATGAKFLQVFKQFVEDPAAMLL
jgi:pyruvate dehydrogenase E2 component (dihydrolipoamide acetyltransferase)